MMATVWQSEFVRTDIRICGSEVYSAFSRAVVFDF